MLQVFEKIKPFDSTPVSLLITTATLSPTRAGRLCGLYTLHLYFYVFAEPSVTVNDCYPTTASSVLLLSKQALQHCFNSRARQASTERLLSNFVFEDFLIFYGHVAASNQAVRRHCLNSRARQASTRCLMRSCVNPNCSFSKTASGF